jgi:hypothetical protein
MTGRLIHCQFSLKALLGGMVVLSIGLALISRYGLLGAILAACLLGACVAGIGIVRKQRWLLGTGACLITLPAIVLLYDLATSAWLARIITISVPVTIIDGDTKGPVPNAKVEIIGRSDGSSRTDARGTTICSGFFIDDRFVSGLGITVSPTPQVSEMNLSAFDLYVRAGGFEPVCVRLSDATGRQRWKADGTPLPPVTIEIRRVCSEKGTPELRGPTGFLE